MTRDLKQRPYVKSLFLSLEKFGPMVLILSVALTCIQSCGSWMRSEYLNPSLHTNFKLF